MARQIDLIWTSSVGPEPRHVDSTERLFVRSTTTNRLLSVMPSGLGLQQLGQARSLPARMPTADRALPARLGSEPGHAWGAWRGHAADADPLGGPAPPWPAAFLPDQRFSPRPGGGSGFPRRPRCGAPSAATADDFSGSKSVVRGSACEVASCTSCSGTPASSAAVMKACRSAAGLGGRGPPNPATGRCLPCRRLKDATWKELHDHGRSQDRNLRGIPAGHTVTSVGMAAMLIAML